MAKKKAKDNKKEITSKIKEDDAPSVDEAQKETPDKKAELPVEDSHEKLSEHEIFAGNEDFYKLLADSQGSGKKKSAGNRQSRIRLDGHRHFSLLQKILGIGIVAVTSLLLYVLFGLRAGPLSGPQPISAGQAGNIEQQRQDVIDSTNSNQEQVNKKSPILLPAQPLSLKVAQDFFQQKDYDSAYTIYNQLYETLPVSETTMRDYMQLQMGLCMETTRDYEQASRLFVMVSESPSPIVRIVANYHLSLLEIQRKRYLIARTRAYKALALIKAIDFNNDWALSFECDCHFLAAECLTRYVLSLSDVDSNIPEDLWTKPDHSLELFSNLSETQLRSLLKSGSQHLESSLLDPKIIKLEDFSALPRWSIASYGAPIEELLSKFAAGSDSDIHWSLEQGSGPESNPEIVRLSPITIYLPTANSQQIVLIASGCAGLLASWEESPGELRINISNPACYSSLSEHVSFLGRHAISLWRKFILTFNSEKRLGNAHFAMGLLQSRIGMEAEAIAEYKLVANRFTQMSLAPYALLHSSGIKSELRDYQGSREDLRQLIEQHPDTEIYGQAYLRLADVTKMAGLNAEAAQIYSRVYNFGLSPDSKIASAFGAAGCFYKVKAYQETEKWLRRYIDLAGGDNSYNLYSAYFLLGNTYLALGQYEQASSAFQYALTEQNSREQYVDAVKALVQGYIEQEDFIKALDALENTRSVALSEEQSVDMLLLKCTIHRMLGLSDTALDLLVNRIEYVNDPQLRVKINFEIAECYSADGNTELARSKFSEVLRTSEPGALAEKTALELADVCLELKQNSQAVSVCLQLLNSGVSGQTKQKALKILAEAYNRQKDYNKAALALSDQWQ